MGDLVKRIRQLRNGRNFSCYAFSGGNKSVLIPVSKFSLSLKPVKNKWLGCSRSSELFNQHHHHDRITRLHTASASFILETKARPVLYHVYFCHKLPPPPQSSSSSSKKSQSNNYSTNGPPANSTGERAKFRLVSFILTTSFALIGAFLYNLWRVKIRYSNLLPRDADLLPLPETSNYVYICDPLAEAGIWQTQIFPWLPQIHDPKYETAWRLVQEADSADPQKRRNAVAVLSTMILEDTQCQQIAQMISFDAAVGLAHSNADPRLVARHRSINLKCPHVNLGARFREILDNMPKDGVHQCVIDYSSAALRAFMPSEQELLSLDALTGFESEPVVGAKIKRKLREEQFLVPCLQAVLSHSRVPENTFLLLQQRILDVLMTVVEKYRCNREIMYLVVKILANLTCDPNISTYMKETGCLRLLAELAESLDLKLSMPARRALHNLDREFDTPILPSGIYQLFPDFRFDESELDIDIVFVHGLLGGAFRTWRREDKKAVFRVSTKPPEQQRRPSKIRAWLDGFTPVNKGNDPEEVVGDANNNNRIGGKASGNSTGIKHASREWKDGQWVVSNECKNVEVESKSSTPSQCWPRDWLPRDIEGARILAVDFDSFITHWTKVCPVENVGRTLFDRSTELLQKLSLAGIGQRPIVWVTHSMGGLLVKHLLTQSAKSKESSINAVANQTRGIMFCSVPHIGSNIASKTSEGAALLLMPTQEVKELSYGSEELKKLNEAFRRIRAERKYKVISFGETRDVSISSLRVKIQLVPLSSADPGYGDFYTLDVDHLNICKVRSRGAFVYQKLVELVDSVRKKREDFDNGEQAPAPVLFPPNNGGKNNKRRKIFEPDKADNKKG